MDAAQYLRKSRAEEGMDTTEVLARHKQALTDYAAAHDIHIVENYEEVVSGESLYARPEMLRLLEDVEAGKYEAVLVMDLDRLSRGAMKDQGIVLEAFKYSGTLIVTPDKTYDLTDEMDDELAEFKTFMSRREYKIINKRLRRGLNQSISAGWYVANAPYGYRKITMDRRPTLEIVEEEAKFVRMMFEMYIQGYGCISIARHISSLGAKPHRSSEFNRSSVAKILSNPSYEGKIVWNQKTHIRKGVRGNIKHVTIYNPRETWTIVEGRHPAIVERELYEKAQEIMAGRYIPGKNDGTVKSPLAGLVRCTTCGRNMQRMEMNKAVPYLLCNTRGCCASAKFDFVEQRLLQELSGVLAELSVAKPEHAPKSTGRLTASLSAAQKELAAATGQKEKLYELLELGEYDLTTFRERMDKVKAKITLLEHKSDELKYAIDASSKADPPAMAKKIRAVLDAYSTSDAARRNALLKSVLNVAWYSKAKKSAPHDFNLELDIKPY